ncbi:UNVERIFIED_CONTAM: hypothetical protein BEN50_20290 [Euhalothece sp. KZN 001]|jgi:Predicted ICC-like phosphoesterases
MNPQRGASPPSEVTRPQIQPIQGEPAALVTTPTARLVVVADIHAGIESALRYERGVELPSAATSRRRRLLGYCLDADPDGVVLLGDVGHSIAAPRGAESDELVALLTVLASRWPVTVTPGNHDGDLSAWLADTAAIDPEVRSSITVSPPDGTVIDGVGFLHGHTWPHPSVVAQPLICAAHEHPAVRLADSVGGSIRSRAWLRATVDRAALTEGDDVDGTTRLVVFPAFNSRSGSTWLSDRPEQLLSPYLPAVLEAGEVRTYLLDGTDLGPP